MPAASEPFWDPAQYSLYADHRLRPGVDLLNRISVHEPEVVVDLGCGPGNLTRLLRKRWPRARVVGIDSSPDMLAAARVAEPALEWMEDDIARWEPPSPADLIFANASLHWVAGHQDLFPRLLSHVKTGGNLAIQMPDNWEQPTHTIPQTILAEDGWPVRARDSFLDRPVARPSEYRWWLQEASTIDIWHTTYHQELMGVDPVFEWVRGSVLAPVLDALDHRQRAYFTMRVKAAYAEAYPSEADGITILPFRRLFMVALK